ncbi:abhydrolase domain-containing protein [Colletotrichum musicola]|uniref:Abhydrolase domain-containing protein n=1 Tax=Colletotrichum musicola TaxID=2175873 RepID=A0A8H6K2G7_9PEZI|nr:abhydrolase domain-containing protein [Colletotrichum musicola]
MPVPLSPILRTAVWVVVAPLGLYFTFLALGATPFFQRHFLYAHKINTLWWRGVNEPERFGFAKGQVTPFSLNTPDGVNLYAWHVMPLPAYLKEEERFSSQKSGFCGEITETESFRALRDDPDARVVLSCEYSLAPQNAGDIAQNHRPDSYHVITDTSSYHVLAIDYRGFGHSTGVPSEDGLIQDAATLIDWVINVAGVPSDRIVLLGQSLGTAVASGAAELYASQGIEFAGIVLVAGFSNLPKMLSGYRIGGLFPVLGPLKVWPGFLEYMEGFIYDKWPSADRLASLVRLTKRRLRLTLISAKDDRDIPCEESSKLFKAAANATVPGGLNDHSFESWKEVRTIHKAKDNWVTTWQADHNILIRQERFPYGGHNDIMGYAPVILAIMRSFDFAGTAYDGAGSDTSSRTL